MDVYNKDTGKTVNLNIDDIIEKLKDIDKEINEQAEKISKESGLEFAEVKQTIINDLIEEKLNSSGVHREIRFQCNI
jgi:hypothetical protein